jgi:hypothetical protein
VDLISIPKCQDAGSGNGLDSPHAQAAVGAADGTFQVVSPPISDERDTYFRFAFLSQPRMRVASVFNCSAISDTGKPLAPIRMASAFFSR